MGLDNHQKEASTVDDGGEGLRSALWDDTAFVSRVTILAAAKGYSVREACRQAGLAADYLNKPAGRAGRSIDAIWRLAGVLNVKRAELIGLMEEAEPAPDDTLRRIAIVADVAAHLYVALSGRGVAPAGSEKLVDEIMQMASRAA